MYKLKFLLTCYAVPFYRRLGAALALAAAVALGASFTAYFEAVVLILACLAGLLAGGAAMLAITVLNVLAAAALQRGFDRFEAAYNAYRKANNIPDIFYLEADLAEAAARESAEGSG